MQAMWYHTTAHLTVNTLALFWIILMGPIDVNAKLVEEAAIDIRTREIAKHLRCTVCQTESVWESNAPLARQMRKVVRDRVIKGESDKEIVDYFLSRYGDYILLEPRKRGWNWLIWAGPFILLGLGGIALLITLRRWVAATPPVLSEEMPPLDDDSRRRIDQELRSLDE